MSYGTKYTYIIDTFSVWTHSYDGKTRAVKDPALWLNSVQKPTPTKTCLVHWVTRCDVVLTPNGLPERQITRSDRSLDKHRSENSDY